MKTILVDAVDTFVIEGQGIFDKMFRLLESYPNPKIVVTNANDEQMKTYGLTDLPYQVFTLKHEPDKTDPEYFRVLFEELGFSAGEVVYFEHNIQAVKSAESVGIKSHWYDPVAQDLDSLKKFLDDNLVAEA